MPLWTTIVSDTDRRVPSELGSGAGRPRCRRVRQEAAAAGVLVEVDELFPEPPLESVFAEPLSFPLEPLVDTLSLAAPFLAGESPPVTVLPEPARLSVR